MVLVGRIARPHGIRGHVVVNPETDFVDARFRPGATLWIRSAQGNEMLTVTSARFQQGRPIVALDGFERVEDVERLAGLELRVPEETLHALDPGVFYHHQLVGCAVQTKNGARVGNVTRVEGGVGGSRLVVNGSNGEILIPLAVDICVDIDIMKKKITIDPPEGLLELNETRRAHKDAL
jgi:16S rRNA processing protein RimM